MARGAVLVRGDLAWWSSKSAQEAALVADRWIKDPLSDVADSDLLRLFPTRDALIAKLGRAAATSWNREEPRTVDGVPGRAIISFGERVVVDDATSPPRLLAWTSTLGGSPDDGLRLAAAAPEALTAASEGAGMIGTTPTDADVRAGRVGVKIEQLGSSATCDPRTCTFRVRVTNHDPVRVAGQVAFAVAGRPVGVAPFLAEPGQTATVVHAAPRPAGFVTSGTFPWDAKLVPGRPS